MARALENVEAIPGYLEFFGMTRAPFARLSAPTQVFHAEQYSRLYAHLSDATENADHLLVLCGADGSGKTTLLNRYTASLGHETSFATFDDSCVDGTQFYCQFLRQLGFNDISGTLNELRHICREFLVHRGLAGDPVLLIVDNAHLVSPSVLEQVRWLAEIKLENRSVISLVLSGNPDLARIMASPAMSLMQFGRKIEFGIRVFTEQESDDYVRHRLRLAGGTESAKLSTEARPLIHRFSGGNPTLINRLCDAVLNEALAQNTRVISEGLVRKVADEQKFVPHVLPLQGQGRRKSDLARLPPATFPIVEERISPREEPTHPAVADFSDDREKSEKQINKLLAKVSRLSAEIDAARSSAEKARLDVDARDGDISALLEKIAQQSKDLERAECGARSSAQEIEQLGTALKESELFCSTLNDDLKAQRHASKKSTSELRRVSRRLKKLEQQKADMQASVRELKAEKRTDATKARRDLKARDKTIVGLEKTLERLTKEQESLQTRAETVDQLEKFLACKEALIEELRDELSSYMDELTATQRQLAANASGTHASIAQPGADAYVGDISAIEVFRNGESVQTLELGPGFTRLMIGRSDDSELCLKSKFVSRHHALVFLRKERAHIEDLRSYNGTIVNGRKVARCDLNPGDTITIGDFELRTTCQ